MEKVCGESLGLKTGRGAGGGLWAVGIRIRVGDKDRPESLIR